MTSLRRRCLVFALLLGVGSAVSSWHSMHNFHTMIWEPDWNEPDFIIVVYVDDQIATHYNSTTRRAMPWVPWMRKVEKDDPHFWDWNTQRGINAEQRMKSYLMSLQNIYNLSRATRIWQHMAGCELSSEGSKRIVLQYGYNGEDYISFDKETLTWTAAVVPAQVTKREWDADLKNSQWYKAYLEEECIAWLQKHLDYGKESLLRREPPVVTVGRKVDYDGMETLTCRAHGFHPKEIDATWRKDGEVWEQETFPWDVIPNSDGTYHTWLSVKIDPKDKHRFRCYVEHDSLPEPLDVAWEEPAVSRMWLILGILMVAAVLFVLGIMFYFWRRPRDSQAAHNVPP